MSDSKVPSKKVSCGNCGANVSNTYLQDDAKFMSTCLLCDKRHYNCYKCALKHVKNYSNVSPITAVTKPSYGMSNTKYYCRNCKQKECPRCKATHARSKCLLIFSFIIVCIHLTHMPFYLALNCSIEVCTECKKSYAIMTKGCKQKYEETKQVFVCSKCSELKENIGGDVEATTTTGADNLSVVQDPSTHPADESIANPPAAEKSKDDNSAKSPANEEVLAKPPAVDKEIDPGEVVTIPAAVEVVVANPHVEQELVALPPSEEVVDQPTVEKEVVAEIPAVEEVAAMPPAEEKVDQPTLDKDIVAEPPAVEEKEPNTPVEEVVPKPPVDKEVAANPPADQDVVTNPTAEEGTANPSQSEESESETEQKSAPISRFHKHSDPSTKLVHDVPPHASTQLPSLIKSAFGINHAEIDKFENFNDAKDYFYKKLSYVANNKNIFRFHVPPCIKDFDDEIWESEREMKISFSDIESLFGYNKLSNGTINFIIGCLNYYIDSTTSANSVPRVMFGPINSLRKLIPSNQSFHDIFKWIQNPKSDKLSGKQLCQRLKFFFAYHDKGFLTDYLDKYEAMNFVINSYGCLHELKDGDTIYFQVDFEAGIPQPVAHWLTTNDFSESHKIENGFYQTWIAKFFGLYNKDMNSQTSIQLSDFDGEDIITSITYPERGRNDSQNHTMISIKQQTYPGPLIHELDRSIMCLGLCLEKMDVNSRYANIPRTTSAVTQLTLSNNFRLSMLKLIANLYDLFNGSHYEKLRGHLYMDRGDWDEKEDLDKWYMIHTLCNNNVYKVDLSKKIHAHHYFVLHEFKTVQSDYRKWKTPKRPVSELSPVEKKKKREILKKRQKTLEYNKKERMKLPRLFLYLQTHSRIRVCFDVSEKQVITMVPEEEWDEDFDPVPDDQNKNPNQVMKDLVRLFFNRYTQHEDVESVKTERIHRLHNLMMKKYVKTYFIYDYLDVTEFGEEEYELIAACIVEEDLTFVDRSITVIHLVATQFGYEKTHHLKTLLNAVFTPNHMKEKTVVFATSFGPDKLRLTKLHHPQLNVSAPYTYTNLFEEIGFVLRDIKEVEGLVEPETITMIGEAKNILEWRKNKKIQHDPGFQNQDSHVICCIANTNKVKYRWVGDKFQVYSHLFLWHDARDDELDFITHEKQRFAKEREGDEFFFSGSGHRDETVDKSLISYELMVPIKPQFQQSSYDTKSNCVWLAAACIIDRCDEIDAQKMISMFTASKVDFEWMYFRQPKSNHEKNVKAATGHKTLQELLQKDIGYNLVSVPRTHPAGFINQMLDHTSSGKYVAQLKYSCGESKHVVGIDLDVHPPLIFDCMEEYAMYFTIENLNYCSGEATATLVDIPLCYRIQDSGKQRKHRRKTK